MVDPCLSRRVSQGHPAGVQKDFLNLCAFPFQIDPKNKGDME